MKSTKWLVLPLVLLPSIGTPAGGAGPRDRDHDRLPDRWERRYHLSTTKKSAKADPDRDGLRNLREYRLRTNPRKRDTDGDGLSDRAEVRRYKTNPRKKDTDGDGYRDRLEIRAGTDPREKKSRPPKGGSNTIPPLPSPTPSPSPAASGGFPDAGSTGVPAGSSLTTITGNVTLGTAGQVYADRQVNGCISVTASNVTIRRVKVVCNGISAIWSGSSGLVVEDTEIDCKDAVGHTGLTPANYTARRVNAHGCDNTFWAEHDVRIEGSYVHDVIDYDPVTDPHTDGVQMPIGASNITLEHNTIYGNYTSPSSFGNSAIIANKTGYTNITINNNLLAGGGYTLYCPADKGTNYTLTNNRFSRIFVNTVGGFGPWEGCRDEGGTGNVYHETGAPL